MSQPQARKEVAPMRDVSDVVSGASSPSPPATKGKLGVMFMNRIASSSSVLYIADANGSNERQLLSDSDAAFEYHASFSPDGEWITFTKELVATPSFEDAGVLSPDGRLLAYVSTVGNYTTNIWLKNIETGEAFNLTNTASTAADTTRQLAISALAGWTGHSNGTGREHTQTLSIHLIRPDGTDFKQLVTKENYSLSSPKWSPDGSLILFYEITREDTYNAHTQSVGDTTSQIASFDVATGMIIPTTPRALDARFPHNGLQRMSLASTPKMAQMKVSTIPLPMKTTAVLGAMRNHSWSPDGSTVVYEKQLEAPNRLMESHYTAGMAIGNTASLMYSQPYQTRAS
ncbi:hypothetical protein VC83_04042 [Pseudogymnoascus destructans]|uniref:Dipeptidylpeptidase IV N-terminal domain-containing protein n=1 Tax=Pseudogymnoascus destructans TaxID=655981 RepID=A0A177AEZ6_9PEZI|nr:uncharacterized protein VC83_04042 [Pseudogymnoascus destructans]OAF59753.1 hypothetical protein VC83_04042 [Pseudogymnoascus destructans]